jgi:Pyruvate/2-oxoacid:ferredoxin oxidoreductase delta subunit
VKRQIVHIDEELCDGCGVCVPACAEGAIQIIDGKARLVSDVYCDGLGACLGECPQGAISIVERQAESFDEAAVKRHLEDLDEDAPRRAAGRPLPSPASGGPGGCPGAAVRSFASRPEAAEAGPSGHAGPSRLANWPVQLKLAPVVAPFYGGARLLLAADCVPFAYAAFHEDMLAGRVLLVGCPKLDDADLYWRKLGAILQQNDVDSIEVAIMEVPCCGGLLRIVEQAIDASGKDQPVTVTRIGIHGDLLERFALGAAPEASPCASRAAGGRP